MKSLDELIDLLAASAMQSSGLSRLDYTEDSIDSLARLRATRMAWSLEVKPMEVDSLDRKGHMFGGAPYTSQTLSWPLTETGRPYCPLVQVNLGEVTSTTGLDFGVGLLQVWVDLDDRDQHLSSVTRVIGFDEMQEGMTEPCRDWAAMDPQDMWGEVCAGFSLGESKLMCAAWDNSMLEISGGRDFSGAELALIERIDEFVERHNYRSMDGDWLLGHPDCGSGAPAGSYSSPPDNFLQLKTSRAFPMAAVSRYANLFSARSGKEFEFFFDGNG